MSPKNTGKVTSPKGALIARISAAVIGRSVHPRIPLKVSVGLESEFEYGSPDQPADVSEELDDLTFETLLPMLNQTVAMGEAVAEAELDQTSRTLLLDQMPNGVVIVTPDLDVILGNKKGLSKLASLVENEDDLRRLSEQVRTSNGTQGGQFLKYGQGDLEQVMVNNGADAGYVDIKPCAILHFVPGGFDFDKLHKDLLTHYQLTETEADLAVRLAKGQSLGEISEHRGSTLNTVRTQSKKVFQKTGTSRQGELISLVLSGDARLTQQGAVPGGRGMATRREPELNPGQKFLLPDGRDLGYVEYGAPDGKPLMFFNYMLGNLLFLPGSIDELTKKGVRLVAVDRPGAGNSTSQSGRALCDWPDDVARLADHIGLQEFGVLGFAAGGPHAAACAAMLSDRVTALGLVSSMPPFFEISDICEIDVTYRFLIKAARRSPALLKRMLRLRYRGSGGNPALMFKNMEKVNGNDDGRIAAQPWLQARAEAAFSTFVPRSQDDVIEELMLFIKDYGFRFGDIKAKTIIWHGAQDDLAPYSHAQAMASLIKDCQIECSPEQGHYFIFEDFHNLAAQLMA